MQLAYRRYRNLIQVKTLERLAFDHKFHHDDEESLKTAMALPCTDIPALIRQFRFFFSSNLDIKRFGWFSKFLLESFDSWGKRNGHR